MATDFLHGVEAKFNKTTQPVVNIDISTIGLIGTAPYADPKLWPINTPILVSGGNTKLIGALNANAPDAHFSPQDTLSPAFQTILDETSPVVIAIRVDDAGGTEQQIQENILGGITKTGEYTGVHSFLAAESVTGRKPRLLCAPGYTHQASANGGDNAVIAELKPIAEKLRAVIYADGPNIGTEDAISGTKQGGNRVMMIDPWIVISLNGTATSFPASAKFAAKQAYMDENYGFWWSLSNQPLSGLTATSRPIDFALGDQSCTANILNASNVTTIIRRSGTGFVSWGNRALDGSFLCVQRTIDDVAESVQNACLQFVDMPLTQNFTHEVTSQVNSYLRQLQSQGAITGGKCWLDPNKNTAETLKNGQVFFDFDIGPTYPAERITFTISVNDNYETSIISGSANNG